MRKTDLPAARESFESLKQTNEHGAEFWSARDLQPLLGYSQWRCFEQAVERAITSCETSGNNPANHFASAGKMVGLGSGSQRQVEDYHLSRFACYPIAQNGDPHTHTAEEFKALSGAAQDAGVQGKMFGVFHDAGYKGLYGGLGRDAIKQKKAIGDKDNLLDRMNATELAANQFRMTQTRDKLARERVRSQPQAIQTHEQVGKEVRDAIKRIGGTLPENIPPAEHIKEVEKRLKGAPPKLELDKRDAGGLLGKDDDAKDAT